MSPDAEPEGDIWAPVRRFAMSGKDTKRFQSDTLRLFFSIYSHLLLSMSGSFDYQSIQVFESVSAITSKANTICRD